MAEPTEFGPPGGPLSGGMEAQQDFANDYNKAAQEKQAAIQEMAQQLAPPSMNQEQGREQER